MSARTVQRDQLEIQAKIVQKITADKQQQLVDADSVLARDMGGLYLISGSSAATISLPDPSECAGAEVIFKCVSAQAHILSGNTVTFSDGAQLGAGLDGTTLTMAATVDASVILKSDGSRYLVPAASGSITIA